VTEYAEMLEEGVGRNGEEPFEGATDQTHGGTDAVDGRTDATAAFAEATATPSVYRPTAYSKAMERLPADIQAEVERRRPSPQAVIELSRIEDATKLRAVWNEFEAGRVSSLEMALHGEKTGGCRADLAPDEPPSPPTLKEIVEAFSKLEAQLGAGLRMIDRLNQKAPAKASHNKAIHAVKLAMDTLTQWKESAMRLLAPDKPQS